ncbi:MAG: general secretion pathway protein GspL [Rhodoferax sp.]|nr:general secretion pathway protein GspL [Rhodoferax sp.]
MSTLILSLPLADASAPEYDYVLTPDGVQASLQGRSVAAMLPAQAGRGTEVVAVVPARALSWHRISLPERVLRGLLSGRTEPARARSVLSGVLEEQLLDEAQALHFAVFAAEGHASGGAMVWVAACDRAWLQARLQALEAAGRSVSRIVAECTPSRAGTAQALLSAELQPAQLVLCTPDGVSLLPLLPASVALAQAAPELAVWAEPAVMALAEQHFGSRAQLQTQSQRLLLAAQSDWNLAQLELSASPGGRLRKRLASGWKSLLVSPQWRPARWALLALLVLQVAALNALAWRQRSLLEQKRSAVQAVLQQTFPQVQLVVDAPKQMQRAVDDLARARGVGSDADLGRVLSIIGPLAPTSLSFSALELSGKQLKLRPASLEPAAARKLTAALEARGLRARLQDDGQLLVEPKESN